jgi:hypothetical protein
MEDRMELSVHHDKIINTLNKHIGHERDRASEAGADREEHGKMLELTGLNKTATAFIKKLHKMEQDKRDDVLRSFDALRFEMEKNWGGQRTGDMFDPADDAVEPSDDVPEKWDDEEPVLSKPSYQPDPDLQRDADDFEKQLAAVAG